MNSSFERRRRHSFVFIIEFMSVNQNQANCCIFRILNLSIRNLSAKQKCIQCISKHIRHDSNVCLSKTSTYHNAAITMQLSMLIHCHDCIWIENTIHLHFWFFVRSLELYKWIESEIFANKRSENVFTCFERCNFCLHRRRQPLRKWFIQIGLRLGTTLMHRWPKATEFSNRTKNKTF